MTGRGFVHRQSASRVIFGVEAADGVAAEADRLGAGRIMLICDRHSRPVADAVAALLGGRVCGRVDGTAPHVPDELADAAVRRARRWCADLLVSIGGGSATGLAKATALRTRLPILAVPTTYAGSEMTPIWGVTGDGHKRTGHDPVVQPVTVVYDPALTCGLPARLSAASGMNALAHLVEAGYAPDVSPLAEAASVEGVRILAGALPRVVADPSDLAARTEALRGAWLAGWVLGTTAMGLHHRICHVLGGAYDLPHAATHSAVLPYAVELRRHAAPGHLARVAGALGADDAATGLWNLRDALGAPASLAELGFPRAEIDRVATLVVAEGPVGPHPVDEAGVRGVLTAAHDGRRVDAGLRGGAR